MKSAAERQKLWRNRQALGLQRANAWVPCELIQYFVDLGALTEAQSADPEEVGNAVATWAVKTAEEISGRKFA